MLNVAISVDSATDYGPRAEQVVAAACEEVIGEQRCPIAADLQPGTVAAWYAVVHPNDRALSSVRIEFRDRTADGVLIEERVLTFAPADSQKSRLASVGSVIAALAAAREGSALLPPPRPATVSPPAPLPAPPTLAPAARPNWSIDLAGLAAPTFGDGPYRLGGLARLHWDFGERPFAVLEGRYAVHSGEPRFTWWSLSAGLGTRLGERAAPLNLEFSGEVVFERTRIIAQGNGQQESVGQTGWGGRVGVGAVWATWRHCALVVGVDGSFVLPRIHVLVGDSEAASVPLASLGLSLGLRFQP